MNGADKAPPTRIALAAFVRNSGSYSPQQNKPVAAFAVEHAELINPAEQ